MRPLDISLFVLSIPALAAILLYRVSIEPSLIPTIVNDSATSTSVIVAFIGAMMILGHNVQLGLQLEKRRLYFTIILVALSLVLLWGAYIAMMMNSFVFALKNSIAGLTISAVTFVSFIDVITSQIWQKTVQK
jgi:hypothetical protein